MSLFIDAGLGIMSSFSFLVAHNSVSWDEWCFRFNEIQYLYIIWRNRQTVLFLQPVPHTVLEEDNFSTRLKATFSSLQPTYNNNYRNNNIYNSNKW